MRYQYFSNHLVITATYLLAGLRKEVNQCVKFQVLTAAIKNMASSMFRACSLVVHRRFSGAAASIIT
jgi:hypothetical protein